jgi:tetratricopeptide (TPR) repeat protein
LVDLIQKERDEYEDLLSRTRNQKNSAGLREAMSGLSGIVTGSMLYYCLREYPNEIINYLAIPSSLVGCIGTYLAFGAAGLNKIDGAKKDIKGLPVKEKLKFLKLELKSELPFSDRTRVESHFKLLRDYSKFPVDQLLGDAEYEIQKKNNLEDSTISILELIELYSKADLRRTYSEKIILEISNYLANIKDSENFEESLSNITFNLSHGMEKRALVEFEKTSKQDYGDLRKKIDYLCLYGCFLENLGKFNKSKQIFNKAVENVKNIGDENFKEIEGSKNKIYVHDSDMIGGSFIFKTGEDFKEIKEEYFKSRAISNISEERKLRFIRPLGLITDSDNLYNITRRFGNFNLKNYIDQEHYSEAREIIEMGLEELLLLQVKSNREMNNLIEYFEEGNLRKEISRKVEEDIVEKLDFIFYETGKCWKGIAHKDFHPGNILVDKKGDICLIDFEKSKLDMTYVDPITLVENYYCNGMFESFEDKMKIIGVYGRNAFDSGMTGSEEESLRNVHLAGVLENLRLFKTSEKFAEKDELERIKKHHIDCSVNHVNELKLFYSGAKLDNLRTLESILGDKTQSI